MSKFQNGDKVKILGYIKSTGLTGFIESVDDSDLPHCNVVDANKNMIAFDISENMLESSEMSEFEKAIVDSFDKDNDNNVRMFQEAGSRKPIKHEFKIGDVVTNIDDIGQPFGCPFYVIKDITALIDEHTFVENSYELAPISSPDESITLSEQDLLFQYHDTKWEEYFEKYFDEYFTEGTRQNGLPAWRGELYNFSHIPSDEIENHIYDDYTLPPIRMNHIIEEHSIRKRINVILKDENFKLSIAKEMHCSVDELKLIKDSIMTKIGVIIGIKDIEVIKRDNHGHRKVSFNHKEQKLISLVGYYDKYKRKDENGESGKSKDHYPPYMSDYDIIKSIKEAYENAEKIETPKKKYSTQEDQILFQGTSKTGLKIQLYYDFDHNRISSAYPVFVDTTNRPDLRHPENRKRVKFNR